MPLKLGGPETERPRIIQFNQYVKAELIEAFKQREKLIKNGWILDTSREESGIFRLFPPPKNPNCSLLRILNENGDDRIVWDQTNAKEVRDAAKEFNRYIKNGYSAYTCQSDGSRGHRIDQFDPFASEILLIPGTKPG